MKRPGKNLTIKNNTIKITNNVINEITKRFPIYFKVELLIFFPPIFI